MIFLDKLTSEGEPAPYIKELVEGARKLRVHRDVIKLASSIVHDHAKLEAMAPYIFMPSFNTWIEWDAGLGNTGFLFQDAESVTHGRGFWAVQEYHEIEPVIVPLDYNLPGYDLKPFPAPATKLEHRIKYGETVVMLKPIIFAILALINSPKIIRHRDIDQTRINKKRGGLGRYLFHPHHEVCLNVDKRIINTVAGSGDGASKCLHFVRTHLRFVPQQGGYTLVQPHWRGDPALGIRDTHYRAERQNSKWQD